jgi:hypothetical protein
VLLLSAFNRILSGFLHFDVFFYYYFQKGHVAYRMALFLFNSLFHFWLNLLASILPTDISFFLLRFLLLYFVIFF